VRRRKAIRQAGMNWRYVDIKIGKEREKDKRKEKGYMTGRHELETFRYKNR